jgi:hypothetical protein
LIFLTVHKKKRGSALIKEKRVLFFQSPDKHKTSTARRRFFSFWQGLAYDLGKKELIFSLEGLGAVAGFEEPY